MEEIQSIRITVKRTSSRDFKFELTQEEAKQLMRSLKSLFDEEKTYIYAFPPIIVYSS